MAKDKGAIPEMDKRFSWDEGDLKIKLPKPTKKEKDTKDK